MAISKYPFHRTSLLRLSFKLTNLKMHSAFMHDQWDSSPPTFRSVYHFSILPQSQIKQDYYRGRRPGDVTLSSRQRQADDEFEKTQNLLARRMYVPPKERDQGRRRSQSRRRERIPSPQEHRNTTIPPTTTDSSPARQSTLSDWNWREVLVKVIIFATALLLCAPSTLRPMASRESHGSAARRDSSKEIRYELVPDRRRWAVPPVVEPTVPASPPSVLPAGSPIAEQTAFASSPSALSAVPLIAEQTAPASSPSVLPAGLDSGRSQESEMAPTTLEFQETIVPIINFRKLLGLTSDSTVTTVRPVSTEEAGRQEASGDPHALFTVLPVNHTDPPATIEEMVDQAWGSLEDPQTPFTLPPPKDADPPVTTEKAAEPARRSSEDLQTSSTLAHSVQSPSEVEGSPSTIWTTPESPMAPTETPGAPPDKPTRSSDVWHYCRQCSQWHG